MSSPRIISFRIDPEKVTELDGIAKALDRDRSYLLNEAVGNYLIEQRRFAAIVEEGMEASRKGELIDHDDVGKMIDSWVRRRASGKSSKKAVRGRPAVERA